MAELNQEQLKKARDRHIKLLNEIDRLKDDKKDYLAGVREALKEYRERERDVRRMIETGFAPPEQLQLIDFDDITDEIRDLAGKGVTIEFPKGDKQEVGK